MIFLTIYRKVPKVTTLVTLGFSSLFISALLMGSGVAAFDVRVTKTYTVAFEDIKIVTNMKTYTQSR